MKGVFKAIGGIVGGVASGKLFWDQIRDLSNVYEEYNRILEQSIIEYRKKYDDLQASCDRLTPQAIESILQKNLAEELPVPTTAELKGCGNKDERLKMWNTMFTNILARILCISYAETFVFLCSRMQINMLYAEVYCPDKGRPLNTKKVMKSTNFENEDDNESDDEDEENDERFREYMKIFNDLRSTEYILHKGFKVLSVISKAAVASVIKSEGFSLEKQIDYEVLFKSLLFKIFERMNGLVYEKMSLLISPLNTLNTEEEMEPQVRKLHEFTSMVASSNDFFFVLKACAGVQLMNIYQSSYYIFEGKSKDGAAEMVLKPVATILPHLLKIADGTTEAPTMASLFQIMGTSELIDSFMFEIYRGIITA